MKKRKPTVKICLWCKQSFKPFRKTSVHCSDSCARKTATLKRNLKYGLTVKPKKEVNCRHCEAVFVQRTSNHIFCKIECRIAHAEKLNKAIHPRRSFRIFERDNFTCVYCGKNSLEDKVKLHADHIVPKFYGGLDTASNLITACQLCNLSKSKNRLKRETEQKLLRIAEKRNRESNIPDSTLIEVSYNKRAK